MLSRSASDINSLRYVRQVLKVRPATHANLVRVEGRMAVDACSAPAGPEYAIDMRRATSIGNPTSPGRVRRVRALLIDLTAKVLGMFVAFALALFLPAGRPPGLLAGRSWRCSLDSLSCSTSGCSATTLACWPSA